MIEDALNAAMPELSKPENADFFDRIRLSSRIKLSQIREHPGIFRFVTSMYGERDPEVLPLVAGLMQKGAAIRKTISLDGIEIHKFKDGADPADVVKMLTWMASGFASQPFEKNTLSLDDMMHEFERCLDLLKRCFYKEEYL